MTSDANVASWKVEERQGGCTEGREEGKTNAVNHRIDGQNELQHLPVRLDHDLLRQVSLGDGGLRKDVEGRLISAGSEGKETKEGRKRTVALAILLT